jgi:hypothetical protein
MTVQYADDALSLVDDALSLVDLAALDKTVD